MHKLLQKVKIEKINKVSQSDVNASKGCCKLKWSWAFKLAFLFHVSI